MAARGGSAGVASRVAAPWNHNIHYHRVLLDAVPPHARRALDVGCGEGLLTQRLARRVPEVVGIDSHPASIDRARERRAGPNISYLLGDFLDYPFEPESFDAVLAVAVLHHFDAAAGLERMRRLLRPGGFLGIVGLARSGLADLPRGLAGAAASRLLRLRRSWHEPGSPTLPPAETFAAIRRIVGEELPGARFRRHLLWRYTVLWRKPGRA